MNQQTANLLRKPFFLRNTKDAQLAHTRNKLSNTHLLQWAGEYTWYIKEEEKTNQLFLAHTFIYFKINPSTELFQRLQHAIFPKAPNSFFPVSISPGTG